MIMSSNNYIRQLCHPALALLILLASTSWTSDAFMTPATTTSKLMKIAVHKSSTTKIAPLFSSQNNNNNDDTTINNNQPTPTKLTHNELTWKLRPPETSTKLTRLKTKFGANALRLLAKLKGEDLPPVLCPRGGRAMLEVYRKRNGWRREQIGRFGFTTLRGPSNEMIDTTIRQTYNINPPPLSATIAAVIYMYVEPTHRNRNVGSLALDVISAIQSVQGVDFTVLVAAGDEGLVEWYEKNGYERAPLLQDVMGSPGGEFGVTMIAPVRVEEGFFEECDLRWW